MQQEQGLAQSGQHQGLNKYRVTYERCYTRRIFRWVYLNNIWSLEMLSSSSTHESTDSSWDVGWYCGDCLIWGLVGQPLFTLYLGSLGTQCFLARQRLFLGASIFGTRPLGPRVKFVRLWSPGKGVGAP